MKYIVMYDSVSGKIRAFYPDLPGNAEQTAQHEAAGLTTKIVDQPPGDITAIWINPSTNEIEPWTTPLPELASKKKAKILAAVKDFVEFFPDRRTRYDTDLKLKILLLSTQEPVSANAQAALTWMSSVDSEAYRLLDLTSQAVDEAELNGIPDTYDYFEGLFGINGTSTPDPDISGRGII